jgi:hypothetical protein
MLQFHAQLLQVLLGWGTSCVQGMEQHLGHELHTWVGAGIWGMSCMHGVEPASGA